MTKTFGISFGALALPIHRQIREQGLSIMEHEADQFQKDVDAINRLRLKSIITDSEARRAHNRLMKQIDRAVTQDIP